VHLRIALRALAPPPIPKITNCDRAGAILKAVSGTSLAVRAQGAPGHRMLW